MSFQGGILLCKANLPLVLAGCGRKVEFPTFPRLPRWAARLGGLWVSPSPPRGMKGSPKHPRVSPGPLGKGCRPSGTAQRDPKPNPDQFNPRMVLGGGELSPIPPSHPSIHHCFLIFPSLHFLPLSKNPLGRLPGRLRGTEPALGQTQPRTFWDGHNPTLFLG